MPLAERTVYAGTIRLSALGNTTGSNLKDGGVPLGDRQAEARATHWRAPDGREMILIELPRRSVRFVQGTKSNYVIEDGGARVTLFRLPFGFNVGSYAFLLPVKASPVCYPAVRPGTRLDSTKCDGAAGCAESAILDQPDVALGVSVWEGGREVREPVFASGHQTGRFRFSSAEGMPETVLYEESNANGPMCTAEWRLVSRTPATQVDLDPKAYLAKGYDLNLQANNVRIAPPITIDHPDPWPVYEREMKKWTVVDRTEKVRSADKGQWIGRGLAVSGTVLLIAALLLKLRARRG